MDNAIKYGDSRTSILLSGSRRKGYVWLFVRNHGKGLSPEEQERIFEPFYRVDKAGAREQGSSGLGLSICRKIMEEHDGLIGVKSGGNAHTTFYIRLKEIPDTAGNPADGNREDGNRETRHPQKEKAGDHDAYQTSQAKDPKPKKSPMPRRATRQSVSP